MKDFIQSRISWDQLGNHAKDDYRLEITEAVLQKESRVLNITLASNFMIPIKNLEETEQALQQAVPGISGVHLLFSYGQMIQTLEEIMALAIPHMIREANGGHAHLTRTLFPEQYEFSDGVLVIPALGESAIEELNARTAPLFRNFLQRLGVDAQVRFENQAEAYERQQERQKKENEEEMREVIRKQAEAAASGGANGGSAGNGYSPGGGAGTGSDYAVVKGGKSGFGQGGAGKGGYNGQRRSANTYVPVKGNLIMGKAIPENAPITDMKDLSEDSGTVVVRGRVFGSEARATKNGKMIVRLFISDGSESVCAKMFVLPQKAEDIAEHLKDGQTARIRGEMERDDWEHEVLLMAKDLEKTEEVFREDTCKRKRVELHAHTKMSAMDGLNEVTTLVSAAAKWGQPATAITDHGVVQGFPEAAGAGKKKGVKIIYGLEGYLFDDDDQAGAEQIDYKSAGTFHIILLAQTQEGLKNLYKLVSYSHLDYFYRKPRIPRSVLQKHREGLIVGSACEAGELFQAVLNDAPEERLAYLVDFYDYLEIQPIVNNRFLVDEGRVANNEGLQELNRKIVELGEKYGKPVAATTDAHYADPREAVYRRILMAGMGYKDAESGQGLYLRTTDEMLAEFAYLGEAKAEEVVITNTNLIADRIEELRPVPQGKFPPKIDHAEDLLRDRCYKTAHEQYGDPLPEFIQERLDKELNSIINNGYAVMYVSAELLVQKSLSDGYLVGSRGSVGSSFAATMDGITEVNPLPPHYICENPECRYLEWNDDGTYDCGVDMPPKDCPVCGRPLKRDGYKIPFETFLGFEGDKEPDIDLNFAGEYQPVAHKYVEEIFGKENVYRAGTIATVADKTAYGYVRKYFDELGRPVSKWEADRLSKACTGVRRTTGQHPGGIVIVPRGHEIFEFCPVQHPANDMKTDIVTTHYEYHSIDQNLLKLDILGHDVPSMIRHLQDMTGVDPLQVSLSDEKVQSIFLGTEALDIKDSEYPFVHGTYGIPEFGTPFVRQMLDDTKPSRFADLVRISGFSHGTDVWLNNAQRFIREGKATMSDAISTRDDIMNYLILKGLPKQNSFKIMEKVRKGKGLTDEEAKLMEDNGVPDWYVESCRLIKYMFPRAHAVAYTMMSYRIAWYKVYYPAAFYAAFFTIKCADFNDQVILGGAGSVRMRLEEIAAKGKENVTKKEEDEVICLEVACEMYARGYDFLPISLEKSDAVRFNLEEGKVLPSFLALSGLGETAAKNLALERDKGPFFSIDQMKTRTGLNKTAIEALSRAGVLEGLPETDQLTLF